MVTLGCSTRLPGDTWLFNLVELECLVRYTLSCCALDSIEPEFDHSRMRLSIRGIFGSPEEAGQGCTRLLLALVV